MQDHLLANLISIPKQGILDVIMQIHLAGQHDVMFTLEVTITLPQTQS